MITADSEPLARTGFHWREQSGVRALTCVLLETENFANAFSTRVGGCSPLPPGDALNLAGFNEDDAANIYENRRRFLKLFQGTWRLATCWQVHGAGVRRIPRDTPAAAALDTNDEHCDALTTAARHILLGVQTADCVPVLLGDARTGACAAVHAGWRGTAAEIIPAALARMREDYGTRAEDVRAAIGPAANVCCYEVGSEVIEMFRARFAYADDLLVATREGHARIDLQRANRQQLTDAGVSIDRIHTAPFCTMCRDDLFFSYRREKKLYGRTGRLLAVIGRNDER